MTEAKRKERVSGRIIPFSDPNQALPDVTNEKAERAVLGTVLGQGDVFHSLSDRLEAGDFSNVFNGFVWWACEEISADGGKIDILTVSTKLEGSTCGVTGHDLDNKLAELIACTPKDGDPEYYAQLVLDSAIRIRSLNATEKIRQVACNQALPLEDVRDQINQIVFEATDQRAQNHTDIGRIGNLYEQRMAGLWEAGKSPGIVTGFKDFDALLHGYFPGEVTVIAGVEKMGKTTLLLSMIRNIVQRGEPVVHFSTEMSQEEILRVFVAMETGLSTSVLKCGQLTARQQAFFTSALQVIRDWPLHIVDEFLPLTPAKLRRKLRAIQYQQPVSLVTVDGLWEMEPSQSTHDKRHRDVAVIMKDLTGIASPNGLNVPMVVCHQLNRQAWQKNEPPRLHHLAESAAVGRTAQVVLVLQRESHMEWQDYSVEEKDITYGYIVADRNGTAQDKRTKFFYDSDHNCYTGSGYVVF